MDKLCSDCCEEPRRPATVALASLEEEAGAELTSLGESVSYGSGNRGLAGACHALQPEYAIAVRVVCPFIYLLEKGDPCVGVAFIVVLVGETVKGSAFGGIQLSENHFLVDVEH